MSDGTQEKTQEKPLLDGKATSEFKLTAIIIVIGVIIDAAGVAVAQAREMFPDATWLGAVMLIIGMLTKMVAALRYVTSRTEVKTELFKTAATFETKDQAIDFLRGKKGHAKLGFMLVVVGLFLFPCAAYAHGDHFPADAPLMSTASDVTMGFVVGGTPLREARLLDVRSVEAGDPAPAAGCWVDDAGCKALAKRISVAETEVENLRAKLDAAEARATLTVWEVAGAAVLGLVLGGTAAYLAMR